MADRDQQLALNTFVVSSGVDTETPIFKSPRHHRQQIFLFSLSLLGGLNQLYIVQNEPFVTIS